MATTTYLNEVELSTIGCHVLQLDEWISTPERKFPTAEIPGRSGVVVTADPSTAARMLSLVVQVQPAARTASARVDAEAQLKAVAARGLVRIGVNDGYTASRVIDGVLQSCRITPVGHPIAAASSRAVLTYLCPDPTWADAVGQLISFSSTPSQIPLGTAPSGGIVRIAAPSWSANVGDPVLTYLNAAGVTLQTLSFTGTLTAGAEYLEIDLDRCTVTEVSSGSRANAISWLASGDFFGLDPMDGDVLNSSYPQLKVTATSGTPAGTWAGTRRWL